MSWWNWWSSSTNDVPVNWTFKTETEVGSDIDLGMDKLLQSATRKMCDIERGIGDLQDILASWENEYGETPKQEKQTTESLDKAITALKKRGSDIYKLTQEEKEVNRNACEYHDKYMKHWEKKEEGKRKNTTARQLAEELFAPLVFKH